MNNIALSALTYKKIHVKGYLIFKILALCISYFKRIQPSRTRERFNIKKQNNMLHGAKQRLSRERTGVICKSAAAVAGTVTVTHRRRYYADRLKS